MKWRCAYKTLSQEIKYTKALYKRHQRRITVASSWKYGRYRRAYLDGEKPLNCVNGKEYYRTRENLDYFENTAVNMLILLAKAKEKGLKMLAEESIPK